MRCAAAPRMSGTASRQIRTLQPSTPACRPAHIHCNVVRSEAVAASKNRHDRGRRPAPPRRSAQRKTDHDHQRRKGGEPGEGGVGLPAADAGQHAKHGGAEMPKVIVGDAVRGADFAEEWISNRHAGADHLVDHGDLGVIEDRCDASMTPSGVVNFGRMPRPLDRARGSRRRWRPADHEAGRGRRRCGRRA